MKLHILGVSGPFPESGGATSGYLLEAGSTLLQFDLGSGVLARLTALTPPESLPALLLSHWHLITRRISPSSCTVWKRWAVP